MRALVRQNYGPPETLRVEEIVTPAPAEHEVLVRIRAASINLGDWELLTGVPGWIAMLANWFTKEQSYEFGPHSVTRGKSRFFSPKSKVLGTDFSGQIEAVGNAVTQFSEGDEVFGMAENFGAFAEYVCLPESAPIVKKSPGLSHQQAAALPQATHIAIQAVRDIIGAKPGQHVLINGAGGGAGTLAIQLAKLHGAEVTAVDGPTKQGLMRSIGADHVIDYTQEDYKDNGHRYDAVLDMAAQGGVFKSLRSISRHGVYVLGGGSGLATAQSVFLGPLISRCGSRRVVFLMAESRRQDLLDATELVEQGKLTPVVDRSYPLEEADMALQRVGDKLGLGKVLITP